MIWMIHPGGEVTGFAMDRSAKNYDGIDSVAESPAEEKGPMAQCTCPYCNRTFGLSEDGEPVIDIPDNRIARYCTKCDYRWNSQVEDPKRCPNCGSYHWRDERLTLDCKRCGHIWESRRGTPPIRCPRCRSVYWDRPRYVPKKVDFTTMTARERYLYNVDEAVRRCSEGESLYDVCGELDVAVLEVAMNLREKGKRYRI